MPTTLSQRVKPVASMLLLTLLFKLSIAVSADFQDVPASRATYIGYALDTARVLDQTWYDMTDGLWDELWWNSANMATTIGDLAVEDAGFRPNASRILRNTFVAAKGWNNGTWLNDFYDDEGWWALNWINAYDLSRNRTYLEAADGIFVDMLTSVSANCGGTWWSKDRNTTNAINNELFLTTAAALANRGYNNYRQTALNQAAWLIDNNPMMTVNDTYQDGLDINTCQPINAVWSYNQGVILGGMVEMHRLTGDLNYLAFAARIANGAMMHMVDENGILTDPVDMLQETSAQFKGVFNRNLAILHRAAPDQRYVDFLTRQADSIWANARGPDGRIAAMWQGPPGKDVSASSQSSALDAFVAAASVAL